MAALSHVILRWKERENKNTERNRGYARTTGG